MNSASLFPFLFFLATIRRYARFRTARCVLCGSTDSSRTIFPTIRATSADSPPNLPTTCRRTTRRQPSNLCSNRCSAHQQITVQPQAQSGPMQQEQQQQIPFGTASASPQVYTCDGPVEPAPAVWCRHWCSQDFSTWGPKRGTKRPSGGGCERFLKFRVSKWQFFAHYMS